MQPKSLSAHGDGQKYQQKSALYFTLHEVASNPQIRWRYAGGYFKSQTLHAKLAFGCEVTKEYPGQITAHYSCSHIRPLPIDDCS
jgi:hypothetical protein